MQEIRLVSRAKINLCLAVTGPRPDGYHELVSIVAPVGVGDTLHLKVIDGPPGVELHCDYPGVPTGPENLVVQAWKRFHEATGYDARMTAHLEKDIPPQSGFGGGSGNAAAMLAGLNDLADKPLENNQLMDLAATLGADVPLFLAGGPAVIRGIGERVERLPEEAVAGLVETPVCLFRPGFGVETRWAYGKLADGKHYTPTAKAEERVASFRGGSNLCDWALFNDFQSVVFGKYLVMPVLFQRLAQEGRMRPLLSGSGSGCFALGPHPEASRETVQECLGERAYFRTSVIQSHFILPVGH